MQLSEVAARYGLAVRECQLGKPRRFIEGYLKINPAAGMEGAGAVERFVFMPTQEAMYRETFGRLGGYDEGMQAVIVKSRDVYATSLFSGAVTWAMACCVPGIRVLCMIDNEDKFKTVIAPMIKGFYENMDEGEMGIGRPQIVHWDTEVIEIRHADQGMQANSFIKFASSKSVNAPRAYKPKLFVFSEAAYADRGSEALLYESVDNSLGATGWAIFESTANGPSGNFYERYRAVKEGRMLGRAVFVPFYADPLKRLEEGSAQYGAYMKGGGLTAEEKEMARRFPSGAPVLEVIAWWRMKRQEALTRLGGDSNAALASMHREYPLDDVSVWTNPGNPRFDPGVLAYLGGQSRPPLETGIMVGGIVRRVWERPMGGHRYVAGMDFATGKGGDATTLQMLDATTMTYVAELHGTTTGVYQALDAAVELCRMYGNALFVPENNTVGTTACDHFRHRHGYENVYYDRKAVRPNKPIEYGWDATHQTVLDLWAIGQGYLNQGALKMPNGALSADCGRYDPNRDDHWPDRMRAAFLALHGASERGLLGHRVEDGDTDGTGGRRPGIPAMRGEYFHARSV